MPCCMANTPWKETSSRKLRSILADRRRITLRRPVVKKWSEHDRDTSDPAHDIDLYRDRASGLVNIAIMDGSVWRLLNGFKLFRENWIPVAVQIRNSKRQWKDLGRWCLSKGITVIWPLWWRKTSYVAEDGTEKRYLPDGTLVPGNTAADGIRCYGAIQDAQALSEGVVASSRYPKHWLTVGIPPVNLLMTQSAR